MKIGCRLSAIGQIALAILFAAKTAHADERADRIHADPASLDAPRLVVEIGATDRAGAVVLAREVLAHATPRMHAEAIRALAAIGAIGEARDALAAWKKEIGDERPAMHLLALELAVAATPKDPHTAESNEAQHYCVNPPLDAELWCWRARTTATPGIDRLRFDADDHQETDGDLRMFDDRDDDRRELGNRVARVLRTATTRCRATYGAPAAPIAVTLELVRDATDLAFVRAHAPDRAAAACVAGAFRDSDLVAHAHRAPLTVHFEVRLTPGPEPHWRRHALLAFGLARNTTTIEGGGGAAGLLDLVRPVDELVVAVKGYADVTDRAFDARAFLGAGVLARDDLSLELWSGYEIYERAGARHGSVPFELDLRLGVGDTVTLGQAWLRANLAGDAAFGVGVTLALWGVHVFAATEVAERGDATELSALVGLPVFDNRVW